MPLTDSIPVDRPAPGVAVIHMPADIDVYTAPAVRELSVQLVMEGRYHQVADLTHTRRIDSTGLGVLVGALKRSRGHGAQVVLVAPTEAVRHTLRITGLAKVFRIAMTVDEALDPNPESEA